MAVVQLKETEAPRGYGSRLCEQHLNIVTIYSAAFQNMAFTRLFPAQGPGSTLPLSSHSPPPGIQAPSSHLIPTCFPPYLSFPACPRPSFIKKALPAGARKVSPDSPAELCSPGSPLCIPCPAFSCLEALLEPHLSGREHSVKGMGGGHVNGAMSRLCH